MISYRVKVVGCILITVAFLAIVTIIVLDVLKKEDSMPVNASSKSSAETSHDIISKTEERDVSSKPSLGDLTLDEKAELKEKPEDVLKESLPEGNVRASIYEEIDGKVVPSYTPWIDWSSGTLINEDLVHMYSIVERYINENEKDKSITVKVTNPTAEELVNFKDSLIFSVDDCVLTLSCKLTVTNSETEKEYDVLIPVSMQYDLQTVVILTDIKY